MLLRAPPACQARLPQHAGDSGARSAGAGCCMLANASWLQFCTAVLQTLPPKGLWASSAEKTQVREKVNWDRWLKDKAGEHAPCAEVLSPVRGINNSNTLQKRSFFLLSFRDIQSFSSFLK